LGQLFQNKQPINSLRNRVHIRKYLRFSFLFYQKRIHGNHGLILQAKLTATSNKAHQAIAAAKCHFALFSILVLFCFLLIPEIFHLNISLSLSPIPPPIFTLSVTLLSSSESNYFSNRLPFLLAAAARFPLPPLPFCIIVSSSNGRVNKLEQRQQLLDLLWFGC
jgi:hypothetical protein